MLLVGWFAQTERKMGKKKEKGKKVRKRSKCMRRKGARSGGSPRRKEDMSDFEILKKSKNYSTQYSRVVPHHSTDCAITSLTSEIRRDPVLSGVYGRS